MLDYGAVGDGTTDDAAAIQACVHAAAQQDKAVHIPAGTYFVSGGIWLPTGDSTYDDLTIYGDGEGETVLVQDAKTDTAYFVVATNLSGLDVHDLTLRCTSGYSNNVRGIYAVGMYDSTIQRVTIENCDYGIKLGGSDRQGYGWTIEDITTRNVGILSFQVIDVRDSIFRNLDLENRTDTGTGMCLYVERNVQAVAFEDLSMVGGSRNCMQLYNGYDTADSSDITFLRTFMDRNGGAKYCFTVDADFSDVTLTDTVMIGSPSGVGDACIEWGTGPTRVVFDGFAASGGAALQNGPGCVDCELRNGVYTGPYLGTVAGVTLTNVVMQ